MEDKKDYQRNCNSCKHNWKRHMNKGRVQIQLVSRNLENYEHMLQYYILIRMKNKMKDFEVKFEEWWEVADKYFTKEMEKNLA